MTYCSFTYNGLTFGAGTPFSVLAVDGLESLPEMRVQDSDRGFNNGMFTGRDFFSGRYLTFEVLVLAGNGKSAFQNFQLLQGALIPQQSGTTPLYFQLSPDDNAQVMNIRIRSRKAKVDPEYTYGYIHTQITAFAPDPRYYNQQVNTVVLAPTSPSGRTYNRTYNLNYGGGSLTSTAAIVNSGNIETGPVVTITGPGSNLTVGNLTTNQYIGINYSASASDVFVLDLQNKTLTLNGTPARNLISGLSDWFMAGVGTSQFYFTGTGTTPGSTTATVVWQNAFV